MTLESNNGVDGIAEEIESEPCENAINLLKAENMTTFLGVLTKDGRVPETLQGANL